MDATDVDLLRYTCPHCHRLLDAGTDDWGGWVRCPECGQPGLPPARTRRASSSRDRTRTRVEVPPQNGPAPNGLAEERRAGPRPLTTPAPTLISSGPRLIVRTGLIVSGVLLLFAYLERSTPNVSVFGGLTVVFAVLTVLMGRNPRSGRGDDRLAAGSVPSPTESAEDGLRD